MPKAFPREFREDVVAVARKAEAPVSQIAKDFGFSESLRSRGCGLALLTTWLANASSHESRCRRDPSQFRSRGCGLALLTEWLANASSPDRAAGAIVCSVGATAVSGVRAREAVDPSPASPATSGHVSAPSRCAWTAGRLRPA
jgi:hypothetical protein